MKKFLSILSIIGGTFVLLGLISFILTYFLYYRHNEAASVQTVTYTYEEKIDSINLNLQNANVIIEQSDRLSVKGQNIYYDGFSCDITDNRLQISLENKDSFEVLGWKIGDSLDFLASEKAKVIITVPADISLKNIVIDNGVGKVEISDIRTDVFVCQVGSGKVDIDNLAVNEDAAIQLGVGILKADNYSAKKTELSAGFSKSDISLAEGLDNYNVSADVTAGLITTASDKVWGINKEYSNDINADRTINITDSFGFVNVE